MRDKGARTDTGRLAGGEGLGDGEVKRGDGGRW